MASGAASRDTDPRGLTSSPARRVHLLSSTAARLARALMPAEVGSILVEAAAGALEARAGALALLSGRGEHVELFGERGLDPPVLARFRRSPIDAPFPLAVATRTGEPIWAPSPEQTPQWARSMRLAGAEAMACVPLRGPAGPVGALCVLFERPRPFPPQDRIFLASLARAGQEAALRAVSHEAEREGRRAAEVAEARLRRLQGVTAALSRAAGLTEIAGITAREALEALGALASAVLVSPDGEEPGGRVLGDAGAPEEVAKARSALVAHAPKVLEAGAPRWPHAARGGRSARGKAFVCLPLMVRGRPVGALGVRLTHPDDLGEEERAFLGAVADLCAQALERARLFDAACEARARAEDAAREAVKAHRLMDDFLGMISHELRTPLTAMLGWTRMLKAGTLRPEGVRLALESIERNTQLQTRLVEDLLDFLRARRGTLEVRPEAVSLRRALERARDALAPAASAKGITLDAEVEPGAPEEIRADPLRLDQVLTNLIGNALKFTPPGGAIAIRARYATGRVILEVRDSGAGIEAALLPHIFEPFRQGDDDGTHRQGLGLGLTIVRELVEAHGGAVRAESRGRGLGTTVIVEMPA